MISQTLPTSALTGSGAGVGCGHEADSGDDGGGNVCGLRGQGATYKSKFYYKTNLVQACPQTEYNNQSHTKNSRFETCRKAECVVYCS